MKILHQDIFWFFLCDEDFVSKNITEESVDLDKFPASRVQQLAKMFESSKATVHHITQVARDPQATQINLMRHQRTELPTNRHNKKRRPTGKQKLHKTPKSQAKTSSRNLMTIGKHIRCQVTVISVVIPFMHRDSNALQGSINAKYVTNMVTFQVIVIKRRLRHTTRTATPKHINFMQDQCMCMTVPITVIQKIQALMSHSVCSYRSKAIMLKVSRFQTLSI